MTTTIDRGYGEYVLRYPNGAPISPHDYTLIYDAHIERARTGRPLTAERICAIHPAIVPTFVPLTLWELSFFRAVIEEHIERKQFHARDNSWCVGTDGKLFGVMDPEKTDRPGCRFSPSVDDNRHNFESVACRLNDVVCTYFRDKDWPIGPLSRDQIDQWTEDHLRFFQTFAESDLAKANATEKMDSVFDQGAFNNFALDSSLSITAPEHREIIQQMIRVESDPKHEDKILLYRGGQIPGDFTWPIKTSDSRSLSYGRGPFSDGLYDQGGTAFQYMKECVPYVLSLENTPLTRELFYFPPLTPIESLFAQGELVHPRLKAWNRDSDDLILGIFGPIDIPFSRIPQEFKSHLDRKTFVDAFSRIGDENVLSLNDEREAAKV